MAQVFDYKVNLTATPKGTDAPVPLVVRERAYSPVDAMTQACIKIASGHSDVHVLSVEPDVQASDDAVARVALGMADALFGGLRGKGKR